MRRDESRSPYTQQGQVMKNTKSQCITKDVHSHRAVHSHRVVHSHRTTTSTLISPVLSPSWPPSLAITTSQKKERRKEIPLAASSAFVSSFLFYHGVRLSSLKEIIWEREPSTTWTPEMLLLRCQISSRLHWEMCAFPFVFSLPFLVDGDLFISARLHFLSFFLERGCSLDY